MEMKNNFAYRLRGEKGNPQGKNRVFFTCHPDDFEKYFTKISDEILKEQDCAIWYFENKNYIPSEEEIKNYYAQLSHMNMMVIPVTVSFLKDDNSKAYRYDFEYAREHNIPLLMIMEEQGLEKIFSEKCGNIQYLDRKQDSYTQKSYEAKLKDYLNSVLLSDLLFEKVRSEFDKYIFLSYRKMDRKEALEVMNEIHSYDFMRDVAIWFDEFLNPGEQFDETIREAFKKSSLFSMVVTPNVVAPNKNGKPNYIIEEEYPMAKESGINILPIEVVKTNYDQLKEVCEGISEPVSKSDKKKLSLALLNMLKKEAWKENNNPEHLYYIGLAYFYGIDVEKNTEKGLELIKKSADCEDGLKEHSFPDAIERLSRIYYSGNSVKPDYDKAIFYMENYIRLIEKSGEYSATYIADKEYELSVLCFNAGKNKKAQESSEEAYERCKKAYGETDYFDTLQALENLVFFQSDGDDGEKILKICEETYEKYLKSERCKPLGISLLFNCLAKCYSNLKNYDKAIEYGEEAYEKYKETVGDFDYFTLKSLSNLAKYYSDAGKYDKAIEYGEIAYVRKKEKNGESDTDTLESLGMLAIYYAESGKYDKAIEYAEIVYEKYAENSGEHDSEILSLLRLLAWMYSGNENYKKAIELAEEAYEKYKEVIGEFSTETMGLLNIIVNGCVKIGNIKKAMKFQEIIYDTRKKYLGENDPETVKALDDLKYLHGEQFKS